MQALSTENQSTPYFFPTPNPPLSPAVMNMAEVASVAKEAGDTVTIFHEYMDGESNQFALGLGNSLLQEWETCGFDEFVALNDFATLYIR